MIREERACRQTSKHERWRTPSDDMQYVNSTTGYGIVAIALHWLMAVLMAALYVLGTLIVDMDYYDPWYITGPRLHLGLGVVAGLLLVVRLGWRLGNPRPMIAGTAWEQVIAVWVHRTFYCLIVAIVVSGYLITTADGTAVTVFDLFEIPALPWRAANQEDLAGQIHAWLANALVGLVGLHSLAALKHHFIDRDPTLRRILWPMNRPAIPPSSNPPPKQGVSKP